MTGPNQLARIDRGLWTLRHPMRFFGATLQRRMQIVERSEDGGLVLISPVPVGESGAAKVRDLAEPAAIVAPTWMHDTGVAAAVRQHPGARVLAVPSLCKSLSEKLGKAVTPLEAASVAESLGEDLEALPLGGVPRLEEFAFRHIPTQSLLVADSVFNIRSDEAGWWSRLSYRMIGALDQPGPDFLYKFFIKDKEAFRESVRRLEAWPVKRIVPCHGPVLEGKDQVAAAFEAMRKV